VSFDKFLADSAHKRISKIWYAEPSDGVQEDIRTNKLDFCVTGKGLTSYHDV
jgi:hypothetical protein